jgi:cell division protein FtsB
VPFNKEWHLFLDLSFLLTAPALKINFPASFFLQFTDICKSLLIQGNVSSINNLLFMRWKLPIFTRNYYFIATASFLVWMLFFDANDFISQYQMREKVKDLEEKKQFYLEKIEEVKEDRKELLSNPKLLEKFAREKYLMKRPSEEVFVVVEEEN